ncbi:hypothetical protein [Deinococcus ruber]|uniref:Uncharacterized protein n=1 Tax=Deinococcus ruber TaxID=1848197 RepID=A0A918C731_9DEIO|nr:hypothetical protein [Deinococcus ruber]GGR08009.1 hypothetical protein GCM10008957_20940 [Deinococcus ruber]
MKHLLFPTLAQADAFIKDLQDQGAIRPQLGRTSVTRESGAMPDSDMQSGSVANASGGALTSSGSIDALDEELYTHDGGGTAEDAGAGAIKGTGVGAVVGAVAGVVATVTTGGLAAVPVILGMAALGSGVGAGVGAIGGAAGVDETSVQGIDDSGDYSTSSYVTDEQHDTLSAGVANGGHAIAVADSVPDELVRTVAERHGGQFV